MTSTEGMQFVSKTDSPHESHAMQKATSEIVACASNDRFGTVSKCRYCGGRWIKAGQGTYMDQGLLFRCEGATWR